MNVHENDADVRREGGDVTVVTYAAMVAPALEAAERPTQRVRDPRRQDRVELDRLDAARGQLAFMEREACNWAAAATPCA